MQAANAPNNPKPKNSLKEKAIAIFRELEKPENRSEPPTFDNIEKAL